MNSRRYANKLLAHRPAALEPGQGVAAFQQHGLLASKVHQASRLDALRRERDRRVGPLHDQLLPGAAERRARREGAVDRLADQPPEGWRSRREGPRHPRAAGGPLAARRSGRLCIDLESMWADFEASVDSFLEFLRSAHERRQSSWSERYGPTSRSRSSTFRPSARLPPAGRVRSRPP